MSAALAEQIAEAPLHLTLDQQSVAAEVMKRGPSVDEKNDDPHPLVPVFILGGISLAGAFLVVGAILALLALRPTGIFSAF